MDELNKIEQIKDRVMNKENRGIFFRRVPVKEWEWFTNWCNEEFEGDYGMGLKWLVQGYMPPEATVLMTELEELKKVCKDLQMRIIVLENGKPTGDNKVIKLLGGKTIEKVKE